MPTHSLYPSFFRLFSKSAYGAHVSTHPTRQWEAGGVDQYGSFINWNDEPISALEMIEGFVDLLLPFFVSSTAYLQAIIYTMDNETAPPRPRVGFNMTGKVGTSSDPAIPASQGMYTFRSSNFGLAKLLFLDAPVTTNFLPFFDISGNTELIALTSYMTDMDWAFAARDNGRLIQFVSATFKLNDKLREEYGLN